MERKEVNQTKSNELEKRVEALEAFLELTDCYTVERGFGLVAQREKKEKARIEATKQRLEKEALPPLINIHSVTKRFDGTGILARFEDLRQEGTRVHTSAAISEEAAEKLRQGDLSGFHMVHLSRDPNRVIAITSEVKDLPQKYEARIVTDKSIDVEVDEDAFEEKTQIPL